MRKELISPAKLDQQLRNIWPDESSDRWLDLERLAIVQVTSEEDGFSIDSALLPGGQTGWRASSEEVQTIRMIFDQPQNLTRIWLAFDEPADTRTQEFLRRWSPDKGRSFKEIVRQEWNFSPPYSCREVENYSVELAGVNVLELIIVPDKSGKPAKASLAKLRLA